MGGENDYGGQRQRLAARKEKYRAAAASGVCPKMWNCDWCQHWDVCTDKRRNRAAAKELKPWP